MEVIISLLIIGGAYYYFIHRPGKRQAPTLQAAKPSTGSIPTAKKSAVSPPSYIAYDLNITVDESVAQQFQDILKNSITTGYYQAAQDLLPIVARYNVRCQQIDNYVEKFKPIYLKKIEAQKRACEEWATASELDREDLLDEFKENAILEL